VDRLTLPGVVNAVATSPGRLYVATSPDGIVRIFDIADERSPVLLGELNARRPVEALFASGDLLHVAEHPGLDPSPCPPGISHCPPGTAVEVFDVSDPASPEKAGDYDGAANPAVHLRIERDRAVLRSGTGLQVYTLGAAQ
jgi:hypothetical protein